MSAIPINWWAIIVATIISTVLGQLWFGPIFGKAWMASMGVAMPTEITPAMKKRMAWSYAIVIVGAFVMNFTLLHNLVFGSAYLGLTGITAGLQAGFWNWLGFIAPVTIGSVLWESRPWKFWIITSGYYLVVLLINGMLLASWI